MKTYNSPRVTMQPHECIPADTISASLGVHGLDVTICAFDRSPESMAKVEKLTRALAALFTVLDPS